MKSFTKIMLSAYPKIPHLLETMDEVMRESAVKSFYDRADGYVQAERLIKKIERRAALIRLKELVDLGVSRLPAGECAVLSDRLSGKVRAFEKGRYHFAKTTYYRKLKRGVARLEEFLEENRAERIFRDSGLYRTAYFRFLMDELRARKKQKAERLALARGTCSEKRVKSA